MPYDDIRMTVNALLDDAARRADDIAARREELRAAAAERDRVRRERRAAVRFVDDEHDFFDNVPV